MNTVHFDFKVEGMNQKQEDALLDMILLFLNFNDLVMAGASIHENDNLIEEVKYEQE